MAGLKEIWRYASMSTNIIIRCVLAVAGLVMLLIYFVGVHMGFISSPSSIAICLTMLIVFIALGAFSFITSDIEVLPSRVSFKKVRIIIYTNRFVPFFLSVGGLVFYAIFMYIGLLALSLILEPTVAAMIFAVLFVPYILGLIYLILKSSISLVVEFKTKNRVIFYTPFKTLTGNIQEFSVARPSQTEIHILKDDDKIIVKHDSPKSLDKLWSYLYHRINALKKDKQN